MMNAPLLYLTADDVRRALPIPEAVEAMREAFRQLSSGQVTLPVRGCLETAGGRGAALVMPCYSRSRNLFCVKFTTLFQENPRRGLPLIQSLVILTDGATGKHLAVMDGAVVTAIRTGAASGVATDLLARREAEGVAVFGAGVQARTQLEAVCSVRAMRRACVFDADAPAADRFAAEMTSRLGLPVERADTPARALEMADVVCTATSATTPVFEDRDLRPGTHINAVGSYRPHVAEIPSATVCRARVVVDHLESALEEAGDLIQPLRRGLIPQSHFGTEVGHILLGGSPARRSADEITLFKSVGVAIQDLCAAEKALENARRLGSGAPLP